jgi:hypothetical protein
MSADADAAAEASRVADFFSRADDDGAAHLRAIVSFAGRRSRREGEAEKQGQEQS